MAELVVADAPFKTYPGGIVVLRAADWLGVARGTLSTEADARSCSGTVVRDSQVVTASIRDDVPGTSPAFQEAEDTLVIDLAAVPLRAGKKYIMLTSYLIEGDWDVTNDDTLVSAHQERFVFACQFGWYGDSVQHVTDDDPGLLNTMFRKLAQYRIGAWGGNWAVDTVAGTEVLTFKAYAQSGTSIEWLIDQIYFLPSASDSRALIVPGQHSTGGFYELDPAAAPPGPYIDGGDGGDDNGKFTWHPVVVDEPTDISGGDGGGDYQRDDSEYVVRVVGNDGSDDGDFLYLANPDAAVFGDGSDEGTAVAYSVHGPHHIPTQVWTLDEFARTAGDGNFAGADGHFTTQSPGDTPEGFGWHADDVGGPGTDLGQRVGRAIWVDGSELAFEIRGGGIPSLITANLFGFGGETVLNPGKANIRADNLILSGTFHADLTAGSASGITLLAYIGTHFGALSDNPVAVYIVFDLNAGTWTLGYGIAGGTTLAGPFTLSGYSLGDVVAFKLEVRRFIARAKVWDAGGSEPGAWDAEELRPQRKGATIEDYDYDDDLGFSINDSDVHTVFLGYAAGTTPTNRVVYRVDDLQVEHDAGGAEDSAWALMEQPETVEVDRIELEPGCWHLVYWGRRDWTEYIAGDGPYLDFSSKVWSDAAAPDLQRAEAVWWYFRIPEVGIVSMNWRSGDRGGQSRRVLVGDG